VETTDAGYSFRLTLSFLEHIRELMAETERALAAGTVGQNRYDSVIEYYAGHLRRAEGHLQAAREAERLKLVSLEHELRAALSRQVELSDAVARGEMDRAEANEQNRHYNHELSELDARISAADRNIAAASAKELGGYIDLPLDRYTAAPSTGAVPIKAAPRPSRIGPFVAVGVALAIIVMGLAVLGILAGETKVEIHAEPTGVNGEFIEIAFRNESAKYAFFFTPWPEGPRAGHRASTYGVELYVMERGSDAFRFLPDSPGCWSSGGMGIVREEPSAVESGIALAIVMDPSCLASLGIDATRIRLLFTRRNGTEAGRYEYTVSG
jgi:hypothetical protein